jgi:phenylacetyl-CoA:acceptor oxidoreductase
MQKKFGNCTTSLGGKGSKEKAVNEDTWIPAACEGFCSDSPCALWVHRVDGVAVSIEPNKEGEGFEQMAKGRGRLCAKPYSLIQKLYNPNRVKGPLKRTNPEKGRGVDPKWVSISWDEALDTISKKLKEIRQEDTMRLATSGPGIGNNWAIPAWHAFLCAFGPTQLLGGGGSTRCEQAEHSWAQRVHGGGQCEPDMDYCNYLIIFGNNTSATGGATEGVLFSDARDRGIKIIAIDPILSVTAAKADEWLPIKPGTDTAFLLAMINIIIHELCIYDEPFLKHKTNSPYLVKPDGYFMRDKATGKVMVWDLTDQVAKIYDDSTNKDLALEGTYEVEAIQCKPAFQVLKDHVKQYTPEWASSVTDIAANTIRRITREFVDNARIGSTIDIEGIRLPYRPAATKIGRGISGVMHSYQAVLANHVLAALIGSIEVPGGHMGGHTFSSGKLRDGIYFYGLDDEGINVGKDGMTDISCPSFTWPPTTYSGSDVLLPFAMYRGEKVRRVFHMDHLDWRNLVDPPKGLPIPPLPKLWIACRSTPLLSFGEPKIVAEAMKKIPFVVTISYTLDEKTDFADIVLPEKVELERYLLLFRMRRACHKLYLWMHIQQPVIESLHNTKSANDIFAELANRLGLTNQFNMEVNRIQCLKDPYKLEPDRKYSWEEVVDRQCKSYTNGTYDLEWFKKNGGLARPVSVEDQYDIHLTMEAKKLRYAVPYMEEVKHVGKELGNNLVKVGIDWWPTEEDYTALPTYIPSSLEKFPSEYDFYVSTSRSALFGWGNNVDIPWMNELAKDVRGLEDILMNEDAAKFRGIKDGDEILVESQVGKLKRKVKLCQGIRPDVLLITSQFGQWAVPIAKDTKRVTATTLVPISYQWSDKMLGTMQGQTIKAKIYKTA